MYERSARLASGPRFSGRLRVLYAGQESAKKEKSREQFLNCYNCSIICPEIIFKLLRPLY